MNKNWAKDYPLVRDLKDETLDENNSLKKMLCLIGENKKVVDFGCATGYFAQLLSQNRCLVTGVEINPNAAKVAEQYCEQVIVADLDFTSVLQILPKHEFDVAVFGDVLEHLRNPWLVLQEVKQLLKPEGYVVASIPNIAHGSIRLALLQGRFEYTELGILDNTHLRFFTRKTVEELFEGSGYFLDKIERTKLSIFSNNALIPSINKDDFDAELVQLVEQQKETDTLQFVLRAFPGGKEEKYAALNERYSVLVGRWEQSQAHLQQTQLEKEQLQAHLQNMQAELGQSQAYLQNMQVELEQTQLEKEQLQAHLQNMQAELGQSQAYLQNMQVELGQLQAHLQQTQLEKEQLQAHLQNTQAELGQSQAHLQQTQLEKEQLQAHLQNTQAELGQSQAHLQQTQLEKEQLQAHLQNTQAELGQSQVHLQQTQLEKEQLQAHFQQNQTELEHLKLIINSMESSKFWKLRTPWFRLKNLLGLTAD